MEKHSSTISTSWLYLGNVGIVVTVVTVATVVIVVSVVTEVTVMTLVQDYNINQNHNYNLG